MSYSKTKHEDDHDSHGHEHSLANHVSNPVTFMRTFAALVVLMILTVWSASWHINPIANNAINLGIATIKATLVIMFFMGVKYATRLTKMFAIAGFVWLTLITITFGDYATRPWEEEKGWVAGDDHGLLLESERRSPLAKETSNKVEVENRGGSGAGTEAP